MSIDVIVIGGGITGAGILRDLALRGVRALLLEKGELGQATTASSSHLIHGGLRYLLYDRLTTHASCWDAGFIVRVARPLLNRLPILWPVYRDHRRGLETVETLLESYDGFQGMKEGRRHLRLSVEETARLVPALRREGLRGGLLFDEYWVDAVGLVKANVDSALKAGGAHRTGVEVVGFDRDSQSNLRGVVVRNAQGQTEIVGAKVCVNAAGPWATRVAALAGVDIPLRLQQGSHLVFQGRPPFLEGMAFPVGLLLEAVDRERYVFVLPGEGMTLVGPTDLAAAQDPDRLKTTDEEVRYLAASARRYFDGFPDSFDGTTVGARPILGQRGPEKLLSRGFRVMDHAPEGAAGLLTVAGGKMSDFRLMAEETVDRVCRRLGVSARCRTGEVSLEGPEVGGPSPGQPPSMRWRAFLDRYPRLREVHALAHLGVAFARHTLTRVGRRPRLSTVKDARDFYAGT